MALAKLERQMLYFGFTSSQVVEDFRNCIHPVISSTIDCIENGISETYPHLITDDFNNLKSLFINKAEGPLKEFEDKVEEIFAIPEQIPHSELNKKYAFLSHTVSDEEIEKLEEELAHLEDKFYEKSSRLTSVRTRLDKINGILPLYQQGQQLLFNKQEEKTADVLLKRINADSAPELFYDLNKREDIW